MRTETAAETLVWELVERWLLDAFAGQARKDGSPMVEHSIRVGRSLREIPGIDPACVFGGYGHDVLEDLPCVTLDELAAVAEAALGSPDAAADAVDLVVACSYSPEEYEVERSIGGKDGKFARKSLAVARWLAHPDVRVHLIKDADVTDNRSSAALVSPVFVSDYESWAVPLQCGLVLRIAELAPSLSVAR
jgi:(p)ppGpp synthase/HD superfamily hydrolase